jgi:hypothetical protein
MYVVIHTKTKPTTGYWRWEEEFRYWHDRRSVLKKRGDLLMEMEDRSPEGFTRVELWKSKEAFDTFRDDIAARVIESVVRHDESLRGVIHTTYFGVPEA